ncbi:MAG: diacylglycerol kinase [Clostridia bacterium]|jgi:diacylglycerol kinase|nr:diacylglycerol kinase [Clostridiales bacterium]MDK2984975.1 diacylglycerol kinase [Clostridia bacterium]
MNRTRIESFKYAIEGIIYAFSTQRNLRIHFVFLILVHLFGVILKLAAVEWLAVVIVSFLVICLEMVNTAIEEVVNLCVKGYHLKAKVAKDVAAGAVFLAALCAVIVGLVIFLPKLALIVANMLGQ